MEEEKEKLPEKKTKKEKKADETLPFCTTAPSPEHARGAEEEEPCDDSRTGDYKK